MNADSVEILMELDRETNGTLVLDLIKSYLADQPQRLMAIQTYFAARDAEKLAFEAHAVKSTVANFGAAALSTVLQRIEIGAKSENWVSVANALTEMTTLLSDFNDDMQALEARARHIQLARTKAS